MKKKIFICLYFLECIVSLLNISLIFFCFTLLAIDANNCGKVFISLQHESDPRKMNDISIFSDIVSKLSKSDNCKYYEIYIQPLYPRNYESIEKEEKIEAIQISLNIQDDYSFNISEGRKFNKDDFIFEGGIIPVILGNNYTGRFCVGDSFTAEYLFDAYEFEVIGILQEHPGVDVINGVYSLDNRVIMPSFFIASDKYITDGIKIHYANKTSGKICTDNQNIAKVQKDINSVIRNTQAGTYSLYSTSINYNIKLLLGLSIENIIFVNFFILCIITILLYRLFNKTNCISKIKMSSLLIVDFVACITVYYIMKYIATYLGIRYSGYGIVISSVYLWIVFQINQWIERKQLKPNI